MDTKALRQKILDLAIHGKLVPQDPNDEPASVLLERIKAEKERLIKEGKIKRSKKSAKSSDTPHYENVPFEVPNSWVWCRLEDIAYVASGSTPDKTCFVENGVPYIKMYNLRNQKIDFAYHPQYITEEVHNGKLQRSRTEVGDLIMNIVGPPLGKLAIIPGQRKILRGISDKILSLCETNESSAIMETNGYRLLLPEGTLDYFNISDVKESSSEIVIYLEEKNELPGEYSTVKVESKGFYDPVVVRDFPIRGKNLFLNIRRRRWILKDDGRYVSRNWKLVAEGSRMTHEFASFLKELY